MKQKLGIVQAIMENQKLLVLDEPFNALDEKSVKLFRELLIEYKKQEKLIILTSHNKEDIESLCDHTYQIQSGQIIAEWCKAKANAGCGNRRWLLHPAFLL